ncbi:MAG: protein kinase, partial [Pirellulaceae bacterium]|nr:protein kinase [Pirellulaceae bacterium]
MERDDSRPNPPSSPGGRDEPEDSEALLGGPQHAPADEDDDSVHHDETIVSDEDDGTVTVVSKSLPLPLPNGSADTIGDELFEDLLKSAEILSSSDLADELEATVDAAPLSERLVSRGKLTPFQVAQVSEGRGPELKFGNYVLLDRLGQGGMGEVFSARHTRMKRVVAIKILPPRTTQSADSIERFHREVEAAAKLQHPNIVAAFDADETNGRHFLVMELVGGPDLSRYIAHQGALPPGVATRLMVQAARGLVHAHDRGVVHRDIKPGNLIVDKDGVLKILDMGLAQLTVNEQGGSDDLTQSGRLMGTVDFMAPEQAKDAKHVDHRADIYSLGCTLYFLLTGRPMSPPGSIANKLLWHQTSAPPSLLDSIESCPPELDALYLQMVAKSPADRPESMQLVVEKFEHLAQQTPAEYKSLPGAGIIVRQTDAEPTIRSPLPRATMVEQRAPNSGDTISDETARPPNRAAIGGAIAIAAVALISLFIWQPWKRATPQQDPTQGRPIAVAHPQADFISWVTSHGGAIGYVGEQGKRRVVRGGDGSSVPAAAVITLVDLDQVDIDADVLKSVRDSVSSTVTELRLSGCPVDNKSAAAIESLVELTVLDLSKTGIDNGILAALARLPKLRELRLVGCDVTDQGLAALASSPQLEILLLSDTPTGDAGLNALKPLESLRKLVVHGTRITESGRSGLLAANKSLEIAWDGVRADSRIASSLLAAGARLVVELPGGGEQAVRARADLPSDRFVVIAVDASGVKQFGDEQAQQLAGLAKLTSLKLQKTQVTPTGLAHLHGLVTLRDLDLGAMRIPAATLTQLSGALADCRIEHRDPPDDAIAKWLLSSGGGVTVRAADGSSHELQGGDSLPQGPFVVVAIEDAAEPGAEIAAQLSDLAQLQRISFREPVETAVAAGLSSLPHLS